MVHPDHPGLYFVGLIQPLGAIMPLAEAQAEWVGDLVTGAGALPSETEMRHQIAAYDESAAQALRGLQAAHHGGRLPQLPRGDGQGAQAVAKRAVRADPTRGAGQGRSKTSSVLVAVATTAPDSSVTTPSVKPTREPAFTTVPTAVSVPLLARTALR